MQRPHEIAIVGMGPKGLHCLERLLAEAKTRTLRRPLHVHVFHRSATFGASPIYDPEQPDHILVNISVGEIDLWTATDPPPASGRGPDFLTWYRERFPSLPPLNGDEYLPRSVVGRYLVEGFLRVTRHLPPGLTLTCSQGEVVDIRPRETGYRLDFLLPGGCRGQATADKILLSTGHSRVQPDEQERRYEDFARSHPHALFVPYVYPVKQTMRRIPAGAKVVMKGIGLTFLDAMLELTEGRGGRFERTLQGPLTYRPSGDEPKVIYPFCRSGFPMAPKSSDLPSSDRPLTFLDGRALAALRERSSSRKLDFESDLLPLVEAEMTLHYYRVIMDAGWRKRLEACGNGMDELHHVIQAFHRACPTTERFDTSAVLDPAKGRSFDNGAEFNRFVGEYMAAEIARSRLGQAASGIKSAMEIWYECRKALGQFLQFGGLTPASHRSLLENWFPLFKRVAFGPPIVNIEKLLAIHKAGIIDFSVARAPRIELNEASGCFHLRTQSVGDASVDAEVLVDARYPSVNIALDASPLYRNLHQARMIRLHRNRDASSESYCSGAIDMERGSHSLIDASGRPNPHIAVIGIPTEGNLVGNLTLGRDEFSSNWAAQVMTQLGEREMNPRPAQARQTP